MIVHFVVYVKITQNNINDRKALKVFNNYHFKSKLTNQKQMESKKLIKVVHKIKLH